MRGTTPRLTSSDARRRDRAEVRVLLVGRPGPVNDRVQSLLRAGGLAVEATDLSAFEAELRTADWRFGFDAALLSPRLPAGELPQLLRGWRRTGWPTPVLAMTEGDPVACLDAGADDCVPPTVPPDELVSRLRAVARRGAPRHRVVRVHDLVIDTDARLVERAGRPIDLTGREYDLLAFLAVSRGQVVPHAALYRRVFDKHPADASNVVAVYIRSLRRKIDAGFDTPLVLTHWGRGYLLRADGE